MEPEHDNGTLLLKKSVWYLCSVRTFERSL